MAMKCVHTCTYPLLDSIHHVGMDGGEEWCLLLSASISSCSMTSVMHASIAATGQVTCLLHGHHRASCCRSSAADKLALSAGLAAIPSLATQASCNSARSPGSIITAHPSQTSCSCSRPCWPGSRMWARLCGQISNLYTRRLHSQPCHREEQRAVWRVTEACFAWRQF